MRFWPLVLSSLLLASAVSRTVAAQDPREPSCPEVASQRAALLRDSLALTADVEAKNLELGATSDELAAAKAPSRVRELVRRREGLRRELSDLLERERYSVERLFELDARMAACGLRGSR